MKIINQHIDINSLVSNLRLKSIENGNNDSRTDKAN